MLPSASTAQTTSNVQTTFRIQMIHLAFSSEHSMNILTWTFIQFSFWTMRESFLNVRRNIPGMFHECYCAHWVCCRPFRTPNVPPYWWKCRESIPLYYIILSPFSSDIVKKRAMKICLEKSVQMSWQFPITKFVMKICWWWKYAVKQS